MKMEREEDSGDSVGCCLNGLGKSSGSVPSMQEVSSPEGIVTIPPLFSSLSHPPLSFSYLDKNNLGISTQIIFLPLSSLRP